LANAAFEEDRCTDSRASHSDIVAIAAGESGGNDEYDPAQYQSEADADRAKALQHYRAGLELDSNSDSAKDAWRHGTCRGTSSQRALRVLRGLNCHQGIKRRGEGANGGGEEEEE